MITHTGRRLAAVAALGLLVALAACDDGGEAPAEEPLAVSTTGGPESSGGETEERGPEPGGVAGGTMPAGGRLSGYVVSVGIQADGTGNEARRTDAGTGATTVLWTTDDKATLSDWRLAPDGRRAAYRITLPDGEPPEALVVRELSTGAEPVTVITTDVASARLSGFIWAPESDALLYGLETGESLGFEPGGAPSARALELHEVELGADGPTADRVAWRADGEALGAVYLTVVAWDRGSGHVALVEVGADGGAPSALRFVDLASGDVESREWRLLQSTDAVASPDGAFLAVAGRCGLRMLNVSFIEGSAEDRESNCRPPATAPLWSPDLRGLAWTDLATSAELGADVSVRVHFIHVRPTAAQTSNPRYFPPDFSTTVEGEGTRALAVIEDAGFGQALLVGIADPGMVEPTRLVAYVLDEGGAILPVPWSPPSGTWWIGWVP